MKNNILRLAISFILGGFLIQSCDKPFVASDKDTMKGGKKVVSEDSAHFEENQDQNLTPAQKENLK